MQNKEPGCQFSGPQIFGGHQKNINRIILLLWHQFPSRTRHNQAWSTKTKKLSPILSELLKIPIFCNCYKICILSCIQLEVFGFFCPIVRVSSILFAFSIRKMPKRKYLGKTGEMNENEFWWFKSLQSSKKHNFSTAAAEMTIHGSINMWSLLNSEYCMNCSVLKPNCRSHVTTSKPPLISNSAYFVHA